MLDFATQARLGAIWAEAAVSCTAVLVTAAANAAAQSPSGWSPLPAFWFRPTATPFDAYLRLFAPAQGAFQPASLWPWSTAAPWLSAVTPWLPFAAPLSRVWGPVWGPVWGHVWASSPWRAFAPFQQPWQPMVSAAALLAALAPWAHACSAAVAPFATYRSDSGHAVAQIAFPAEAFTTVSANADLLKQSLASWTPHRLH